MTDYITPNFKRSEFACQCNCGFDDIDKRVPYILQQVRDHFGVPIRITSGCRCEKHNAAIGGSPRSQHMLGKAADFVVRGVDPGEVARYIDEQWPNTLGLGRYGTFTHVDVRRGKARW